MSNLDWTEFFNTPKVGYRLTESNTSIQIDTKDRTELKRKIRYGVVLALASLPILIPAIQYPVTEQLIPVTEQLMPVSGQLIPPPNEFVTVNAPDVVPIDDGFDRLLDRVLWITDKLMSGVIVFSGISWMFGNRTKAIELLFSAGAGYIIIRHHEDIKNFFALI